MNAFHQPKQQGDAVPYKKRACLQKYGRQYYPHGANPNIQQSCSDAVQVGSDADGYEVRREENQCQRYHRKCLQRYARLLGNGYLCAEIHVCCGVFLFAVAISISCVHRGYERCFKKCFSIKFHDNHPIVNTLNIVMAKANQSGALSKSPKWMNSCMIGKCQM